MTHDPFNALLVAWERWDHQCLDRSKVKHSMNPTTEATTRMVAACDEVAALLGWRQPALRDHLSAQRAAGVALAAAVEGLRSQVVGLA